MGQGPHLGEEAGCRGPAGKENMARIRVPDGEAPEIYRVWALRPELGEPVQQLSAAVYGESRLPGRERECVRMRIAQINDCPI